MLQETLKQIKEELNTHFSASIGSFGSDIVVLGNIASIDTEDGSELRNKVVMTLVNVEEDKILKNGPFHSEVNGSLRRHNPKIFLNLYVLFSATHVNGKYEQAISSLDRVITFFQGKFVFNHQNTPTLPDTIDKLIFDIHTLNFEYLNHLWGILGGKYLPSILYKVRLFPILANEGEEASRIETIVDNGSVL